VIDSHCHLADEKFASDLPEVVARARAAGLSAVVCILSADEPKEVARAAVVSAAWPAVLYATGVHPHRAAAYAGRAADAAAVTRQSALAVGAVAIGEIGLDYHYDFAPRDVQREVFAAQVALAVELAKPVVIHTRLATEDTMAVLREGGAGGSGGVRGVMHCFSGTPDEARQALDLGFYISLAGIVTFPKADSLRDVARLVPVDRLLVETDAPFLAPVPHRGRRNEPAWARVTLETIARLRGMPFDELSTHVAANVRALMSPPAAAP
jgi:TatD DNase family protein